MKKLIILAFVILIMASSAFAWDIVSRKMQATDEYGGTLTVWLTVSGTTVVKRIEIAHASAKKLSRTTQISGAATWYMMSEIVVEVALLRVTETASKRKGPIGPFFIFLFHTKSLSTVRLILCSVLNT